MPIFDQILNMTVEQYYDMLVPIHIFVPPLKTINKTKGFY